MINTVEPYNSNFSVWTFITGWMFSYFVYYASARFLYRKNLALIGNKDFVAHIRSVYAGKVIGLVMLGCIPLLWLNIFGDHPYRSAMDTYLDPLHAWQRSGVWLLVLVPVILMITWFGSKKPFLRSAYPEIRMPLWSRSALFLYLASWVVYLLIYEFFFRFLLFIPLIDAYGLNAAIAINTGLYALAHVPKGKAETIGAIPLGAVLCVATYDTQSLLVAFIAHMAISFGAIIFCLRNNPEMRMK